VPEGLPQHAWYFFAIFAGVIVSLGAIFGAIFFAVFTVISLPWVLARIIDLLFSKLIGGNGNGKGCKYN
jgi:hypothetical protein